MHSLGMAEFDRKLGWEQIKREEEIKKLLERPEGTLPYYFRDRKELLSVIRVPINLLMYRLENGRTVSVQEEYLVNHPDLADDFFTRDKNSIEAQEVQHQLLLNMVASSTELNKYFKDKTNKQMEPLICTKQGFVVNGNRRLSCWRNLFWSDTQGYCHFRYIEIAILPIDDEDAIEQLEADLQIAPDIQEDYSWHAEAKMIKHQRDTKHKTIEQIRKLYRKKTVREVEDVIEMLDYADEYLARIGRPKRWSLVDDHEWAFREMIAQRRRFSSPIDKEAFKEIAFSLIAHEGEDRAYKRIKKAKQYYPQIAEAIVQAFPVSDEPSSCELTDTFDLLLGGNPIHTSSSEQLLRIVSFIENTTEVAEIAEEIIASQTLIDKESKSTSFVSDQVRKANSLLQTALMSAPIQTDIKVTGLKEQLAAIDSCVSQLKDWLRSYETTN